MRIFTADDYNATCSLIKKTIPSVINPKVYTTPLFATKITFHQTLTTVIYNKYQASPLH